MKRRTQIQLYAIMLEVAREKNGCTKYDFMRAAETSWAMVCKYIEQMTKGGLLFKRGKRFYTTEKGLRWLKNCKELEILTELRDAIGEES